MEVNVSSHGYYVSSSILAIFRSDQTLLFVAEEPRPLHWTRTSYCCHSGSCFPDKLLEGYRRLDEGSTTQTWAHIHLYTAPRLQYRSEIVISEPWPSARLMELPVRIERTSEHYKCPVLTFVLWEHILYGRGPRFRPSVFRVKAERTTIVLVPHIGGPFKVLPIT